MVNPRRIVPFLVTALLLLPAACLQFDAQEITLHYDAKEDRLDALLVYRGLYANESLAQDVEQLRGVLQTGEFAIWSNWPLKPKLVTAKGVEKPFADHCEVENGSVFTTPTGQLCAYQMVRVHDLKGMLRKVNTAIAGLVAARVLGQPLGADGHRVDDDTRDLLVEVTRGKVDVVSFDGSALVVTLPCSDADHAWLMRQIGDSLLPELGRAFAQRLLDVAPATGAAPVDAAGQLGDGTARAEGRRLEPDTVVAATRTRFQEELQALAEARVLFDNAWSLQRLPERTVFTLGFPHVADNTLRKAPTGRYRANLQAALAENGIAVEPGVPDQELQRRFAAFHGRAAVLPPALAELRQAEKK